MLDIQLKDMDTILKKLNGRRIICYGAGKHFDYIMDIYVQYNLAEMIDCVADKFPTARHRDYHNLSYPLISMNDLCEIKDKNFIILITVENYMIDVIEELDGQSALDGVETYIGDFLRNQEGCNERYMLKSGEEKIPRIIHYCWFGGQEIPEKFNNNIESWKKFCPDYEIIQWNESNYDIKKNKYMLQAYRAKKWGFVSDYARVDLVYTYGGIYLDTDVELIRSLDSLLVYNMFCGFEDCEYVNFGLGFGAASGNVVLNKILDLYQNLEFINSDGSMNLTACPIYQTRIMEQFELKKNGKTQEHNEFIALSKDFFSPIDMQGIGKVTENTYSIHQYAASWLNEDMMKNLNLKRKNGEYISKRCRLQEAAK